MADDIKTFWMSCCNFWSEESTLFDRPRSESIPLTLDKLPVDVLENVTDWLPLADRMSLRKVSRDLREFVDSAKLHCRSVKFWCTDDWARIRLDELDLTYGNTDVRGCTVTSDRKDTRKTKTYQDHRHYEEALFDDAATIFENAKLKIDRLEFIACKSGIELKFVQFLKSLNLRLNVRSVRSDDFELLNSIQEFLKPDDLEEILFMPVDFDHQFIKMVESNLDILKNPKLKFGMVSFTHCSYRYESPDKFPEILKMLKTLNIQLIKFTDRRWILPVFRSLNPDKVEQVLIDGFEDIGYFGEITVEQFNEMARLEQWKRKTRFHYCPMPDEIGLEQLLDFKGIQSKDVVLTEENLIKIRNILLKSPHFDYVLLENRIENEHFAVEMEERIDRIMCETAAYDASTRRLSIPNSPDYFLLELKKIYTNIYLCIDRISQE